MLQRNNLFRDADSRTQLQEAQRPQLPTRRQRTAINRTLRRLGWTTRRPSR